MARTRTKPQPAAPALTDLERKVLKAAEVWLAAMWGTCTARALEADDDLEDAVRAWQEAKGGAPCS
jgi:hypothetical protein